MNKKKISQLPAAGALTGAELVETVQGGVNKKTTTQAVANLGSGGGGGSYSAYVALLTQTGTNPPVATVIQNTLSGVPVWSRFAADDIRATLAGEFTENKTVIFIVNGDTSNNIITGAFRVTDDVIKIKTTGDTAIIQASIEIRVYP